MRATDINSLSLVSVLLLVTACTTIPARADVIITATRIGEPCDGRVLISYDATSETNLVIELAVDVRPENNADITEVTDTNECLKVSDPGYEKWVSCGKPDCWCYRHQCQGDSDGFATFGRYVSLSDLECLKRCFGKTLSEICGLEPNCLCCDFDHLDTFLRPVALSDLHCLKYYFGKPDLPDCPMTHINYWEEP